MNKEPKYNVDTNALSSEIFAAGFNIKTFCEHIGMERAKFSRNSKGLVPFNPSEIALIQRSLHLSAARTCDIFLRY